MEMDDMKQCEALCDFLNNFQSDKKYSYVGSKSKMDEYATFLNKNNHTHLWSVVDFVLRGTPFVGK